MNVLVLHSELGVLRGGGENFTRNLFTAFSERGHRVAAAFVADPLGRYPISLPTVINPIPISGWWSRNFGEAALSSIGRHIPTKGSCKPTWDRVQNAISWRVVRWHNKRFQIRIEKEFLTRWNSFDAVYVHGDSMLASKAAIYRPTILRLPGPVSGELSPFLRKVQAVCANGDALKHISEFLGESVIELSAGLDGHVFKPGPTTIRQRFGWTDRQWVIGYVGRLTQVKGVDLLATAFHELSRTSSDARLLIIGRGETEGTIRSALAKEFRRGMVHIEPDVAHEQLPQWYRAMDLLVMPSRYENFSNTILEAMACGVPIVASDIGGNRTLPSDVGSLFQPNSASSLTDTLLRAATKTLDMKERAVAASHSVRKRFSWAASAERLETIMKLHLGVKGD